MLRKGSNEMLCNYNRRYCEIYNEIEEFSKELVVVNYKLRTIPGEKLWDDLTLNPPTKL